MTTAATESRSFNGTPVPTSGAFSIDPAHTYVGFSARHLMVARVRGRFAAVAGTVVIGDDPLDSSVDVTLEAASLTTGNEQRDAHLRSPDFFDVDAFQTIRFTSTATRTAGAGRFEIDGLLTIKEISQPVALVATVQGVGVDPWGHERAGFSATAEVDREAWGLTWNQALATGGVLIGRTVLIEIEAEVVRDQ